MSNINLKKIYIGGQNMSGKGQLLQFLNSHSNIFIFPFHKFVISYELDAFLSFSNNKKKFNIKTSSTFNCYEKSINFDKHIPIQNLISYLLKTHSSGPDLLLSSLTKKCRAYAGDQKTEDVSFNFNIDKFFQNLKKYQERMQNDKLSIEQLEDIIFLSFIKSVDEYKNFNIKSDYFALFAGNGLKHIETLDNYFENYKIIMVKRNILNRLYANSKRSLRLQNENFSKIDLYYSIIYNLKNNIEVSNNFENSIKKIRNSNEKLIEIEFDELIYQTVKSIKLILSFLQLKFEDDSLNPSWINSKLSIHDEGLIENDTIELYFNNDEIDKIRFFSSHKIILKIYIIFFKILSRI